MAGAAAVVGAARCRPRTIAAQTADAAKGAALLAEARKAVGGEEKLAAIKRLQVKGEMRRGQGDSRSKATAKCSSSCPTSSGATSL